MKPLEVWGGLECTVNRVADRYYDQLSRTGHAERLGDLERFHALGLRTLRYPILWERTAPDGPDRARWEWTDERLHRLRELGIRPIVGLVHHGSGPPTTSLLDSSFGSGLAEFARAVAERYPWIDAYTPINEPLTTARFSALYGHWYPHRRDSRSCLTALLHQIQAIRAAMRAVRTINAGALLVQTEDICEVSGTPLLDYQVRFERERRWLSLDLLSGRVDSNHALRDYLIDSGIGADALDDLHHDPCPPDIIGLNYYLTSDRFLDHRIESYQMPIGGNGRHRYIDIEAVRVPHVGVAGHEHHLRAAAARYGKPIALTEVHAACSREEQVRWFVEAWRAADSARQSGVDVAAVTAWALMGAFDWDTLVTCDRGSYESGVFDVRSTPPRATLLAKVVRDCITTGQPPELPLLDLPGWWRRAPYKAEATVHSATTGSSPRRLRAARRLIVVGQRGTLGQAVARACDIRGLPYVLASREMIDIADAASVARAIQRFEPWAVVNAAGHVDVDRAEAEPAPCFRDNATGAAVLAAGCASAGVRLVTFSSDLVFDGLQSDRPYVESDRPGPVNTYGRSKLLAETKVLARLPAALIIRTSAFFGPIDRHNFITRLLARLRRGLPSEAAGDVTITPTYVPDLVHATLDLLLDEESRIWHLANSGAVTWADFGRLAAERAGLDPRLVVSVPSATLAWKARRPRYSALASERGAMMPPLERALDAYVTAVASGCTQVDSSCA